MPTVLMSRYLSLFFCAATWRLSSKVPHWSINNWPRLAIWAYKTLFLCDLSDYHDERLTRLKRVIQFTFLRFFLPFERVGYDSLLFCPSSPRLYPLLHCCLEWEWGNHGTVKLSEAYFSWIIAHCHWQPTLLLFLLLPNLTFITK